MGRIIYFRLGESDRITFERLVRSLRYILGILEDIDAAISQRKYGSVRWEVAVLRKESPPLLGIEGHPVSTRVDDNTPRVQSEVLNGLSALSKSTERNPYYSDSVLWRLKSLAGQARHLGRVTVYTDGGETRQEAQIDESVFRNIEQIIGPRYVSVGSVTGNLDAITVHRGNEFRVWDENTGKPVVCKFEIETEEVIKQSLRQKVTVYGEVHSNQRCEPIWIAVREISPTTPKRDLPTIEEMSGLVEDMTGGKTLAEYLEDIRNE